MRRALYFKCSKKRAPLKLYFQNNNYNIKMESQTGSVIPGIISKQELLFAGTMIEITNMVELTANAFDIFGKNIQTIKDRET